MIAFIVSIAVRVFYSIRALNLFTFNAHKYIHAFVCAVSFCVDFLDYFDVPSVRFFDVFFFRNIWASPKLFIRVIELIEICYATDQ